MAGVRVEWAPEGGTPQTGLYGLIEDQSVLDSANQQVDEPHLWFRSRDGRIFGIPSKSVISILAVPGG